MAQISQSAARSAGPAVHSLDHFAFTVPDLDEAARFYSEFGLDVRRVDGRVDLYTFGNPHRWGSIHRAPGRKKLQYLCFGAYEKDIEPLRERLERLRVMRREAHPLAQSPGLWCEDPQGIAVQVIAGPKVSPSEKKPIVWPAAAPGKGACPARSTIKGVRPTRLSHTLMFSSDVMGSARFYIDALGLKLSDYSGDGIAFLHGVHASDHHLVAFAKSEGPGLHHSSWDVATMDEVGLGMQQMVDHGHKEGWGVGRHVLGSNYFYYVRDPWGSFAEYSHDIDFISADIEWKAKDHPPEDSFYLWGPPVPDYFIMNCELPEAVAA
jgi:catechol 2,3-dioxygenase-like lactoylglutathione lyase family enzyme